MLYLLDANVLIDANRDYYGLDQVPEFWDWLINEGSENRIKIPIEQYEEIVDGTDNLAIWLKEPETKDGLLLSEIADIESVQKVTYEGYASDLTDDEIEKIGRDPFLIAYAIQNLHDYKIVTTEVSKPTKTRANRHVPDVCNSFGIHSCNTFDMLRELRFTTGWNR